MVFSTKFKVVLLAPALMGLAIAGAQAESPEDGLLHRIREHLRIPADYGVTLGSPEPAVLPGLVKRSIEVSNGTNTRKEFLYLSADGRYLFAGRVFDLSGSSLKEKLASISTKGYPSLGPRDAPVTIIEYGDFQCAYCERAYWMVKYKVLSRYGDRVRFVYKDLPLTDTHPWALQAATAARCAFHQSNDAFWRLHDFFFEYQDELTPNNIESRVEEIVSNIELDKGRFEECLSSADPRRQIEESIAEAQDLGITGTPAFVVGGELLRGAPPFPAFRAAIERSLNLNRTEGSAELE